MGNWAWLVVAAVAVSCAAEAKVTLHVAPGGSDAASGRGAAAGGPDGALASLAGARDAVRKLRRGGEAGAIDVLFHSGVYPQTGPVLFTPEDSGRADAPVTYAAAPGEQPVLSGGRQITGWTRGEGSLWVADLPEVRAGRWEFHQLTVNGTRADRCRTPNQGWLRVAGPVPEVANVADKRNDDRAKLGFTYQPGDLNPDDDWSSANVVLYHSWTNSIHWVKSVDPVDHTVRFTNKCGYAVGAWDPQQRYHVENVRSALDQPGEWFLDGKAGKLYYWPRPGEAMTTAEVIAPVATELLHLQGDAELGLPIAHLVFRGLTFADTDWQAARTAVLDGQAATFLGATLLADGARDCRFEDLRLTAGGGYGIWLRTGCKDNQITRCEIADQAGGAVRIGEGATREGAALSERNTVDNCFLHHLGRVFTGACGVLVQRASGNRITHNEISDLYYTGISVGWSWGYQPTSAHDNLVEYNHVHHLGWGVMSDMGGIYTLGISPGTRIANNVFHDILAYSYGGWGLYTDEGSSNIVLENNVVYRTKTGGFHQHYGRDNVVRNNIFAFSAEGQVQRTRNEEHNSFDFDHNLVYFTQGETLSGNWTNDRYVNDYNLYWNPNEEPDFMGLSLEEWRQRGHDSHSVIADPKFVDPAHGDLRLQPGSPALALGFKPIDVSGVGLYGDPAWVAKPKALTRPEMVFAPPKPPLSLAEDFEATAVGQPPAGAHVSAPEPSKIQVTDELAASGKHCLKVTDAPGLKHEWDPHFYYQPGYRKGLVTMSFDLRVEPGAKLYCEWRDNANPYRVGPSLDIAPDGQLTANGKAIRKLPASQWVHFQLTCRLQRATNWTLTLTVPGEAPQTFATLPCAPEFRRLEWLGFSSTATDARVYYLDNVKLNVER